MLIIISIAAFIATLLGGLFALRFRDKLHLILGFSAGAIIGVAFFDLLPEAIELGKNIYDVSSIISIVAFAFIVYMVLDRFIIFHSHSHNGGENQITTKGKLGAGSLSIHSLLDGIAIGIAFQASTAVGIVVAIAILVHDISDGINTVGLILKNEGNRKQAFLWLILDAIAPVIGVISTFLFSLSSNSLSVILSIFCGFFLYIGASDLLPESHHNHPTIWTTVMTILGVLVLYIAINLVNI